MALQKKHRKMSMQNGRYARFEDKKRDDDFWVLYDWLGVNLHTNAALKDTDAKSRGNQCGNETEQQSEIRPLYDFDVFRAILR